MTSNMKITSNFKTTSNKRKTSKRPNQIYQIKTTKPTKLNLQIKYIKPKVPK